MKTEIKSSEKREVYIEESGDSLLLVDIYKPKSGKQKTHVTTITTKEQAQKIQTAIENWMKKLED